MMHGEVDIDAIRTEAHMEGFKRGYAQAFQSLCEPLASFNWLLQRDDSGDWCLEWVCPGDEFEGDEQILVHVTITARKVEPGAA